MSIAISLHVGASLWCDVIAAHRADSSFQVRTYTALSRAVFLRPGVIRRVFMSVYAVGSELSHWPSPTSLMTQHLIGMNKVLRARNPFKIFREIVHLVSVKVVYLKSFIARNAVEGQCYESGYLPLTGTILTSQDNMLIANSLGSRLQYSPSPRALPTGVTPNASEVRRAIQAKVSRDGEPVFGSHQYIVSRTGVFMHEEDL